MAGSFDEEYNALSGRIGVIYDVAQAKGATAQMPAADQRNTYNLSGYVDSIVMPQQPIQDDWLLPYGWPDLREVLKDDPFKDRQGVAGRCVVLIEVMENGLPGVKGANVNNQQTWGWFNIYNTCQNSVGCRTSNDPNTFIQNTTTDTQYVWDSSKYIQGANGQKFVWIEVYYNRAQPHFGWSSGAYTIASSWIGLRWICGDGTYGCLVNSRFARNLTAITGFTYITIQPYALQESQLQTIPPLSCSNQSQSMTNCLNYTQLKKIKFAEGGMPLSSTDYSYFVTTCLRLEEFPDVLFEGNQLTSIYGIASNCASIRKYPKTMDFSKVTSSPAQFWNSCNYLRQAITELPEKMIFPDALTLSCQFSQMGVIDYDTLARFDNEGHLSGGWLYGWTRNPGYTTDLSVRFQSSPISWMTEQQKSEVSSYLLTKGIYIYNI